MNEVEKRMMKLEKEQLVVTLSVILTSFYGSEGTERMVQVMETHEYRKYLKKRKLKINIIGFLIAILLYICVLWLVGGFK